MNPLLLQKTLKDNAADVNDFCKDLKAWGEEMKKKENFLNTSPNKKSEARDEKTCKKRNLPEKKPVCSQKEQPELNFGKKMHGTDYNAWEKFDADAECEKIDYSGNDESDLTDECDVSLRDQAYVEKENGNKFVKKKQWDQAIACYTKAINCYSYDPIFYANRALCFLKKNNFMEAESDCTLSLKLDETYVKALQRRAAAREQLGKLEEAKQDLQKVLKIEPKNNESRSHLEEIQKKLSQTVEVERPVSKFTASRNKTNSARGQMNPKICQPRIETSGGKGMGDWHTETDGFILVKEVNKPVHLQSKKPLRRVQIQETNGLTVPLEKSQSFPSKADPKMAFKTDDLKIVERQNVTVQQTKKSKNETNAIKMMEKTDLQAPQNSVQFYSQWKHLRTMENKYRFMKLIKPEALPVIFKEDLESNIFSEILEVFLQCFVKNNEDVYDFLLNFTKIRRFSTIVLFMSDSDKKCLQNLFIQIRERLGYSVEDINVLLEKYELSI